ncbi:hypothetical protein ALC56_11178 [Trachymyrmex septentrionalis]|uniref:Uncharacterized protein n=1 Tax=Trachymyrmex septentrionalis TaxID=34720 RepID=A0A195F3N1_9HYME|nr:hypothetical protein ALC56_11178 [Trachymyrmex septentrionalis]
MPLPGKKSQFKTVILIIMLDIRFRDLFIILISTVFDITLGQSCIFFFFFFFFCFKWFLSTVVFLVISFLLVVDAGVVGRARIGIVNSNNGAAVVTLGFVGTSSSPVKISNKALKPNGSSSSSSSSDSCASTSEPSGTEFVMGLSSSSSSSSSSEPSPKKSSSSSSSEAASVSTVGSGSAGRSFRPSGPNLKFKIKLRNTIFHTT